MNNKSKKICLCDNPTCRKCLLVNCQDDNCAVHSVGLKIKARESILSGFGLDEEETEVIKKEISRLKKIAENFK